MILAALSQESVRGWCLTFTAVSTVGVAIVYWVKLTKQKINAEKQRIITEFQKQQSEQAKQLALDALIQLAPAMKALAEIAPALTIAATEFGGMKATVATLKVSVETLRESLAENTEMTKQVHAQNERMQDQIEHVLKHEKANEANVAGIAEQMKQGASPRIIT